MGRCRLAVAAALMAERAEVGCVQVLGSRAELGWLQLCSWQKGQKLAECSCLAAGKKAEIGWLSSCLGSRSRSARARTEQCVH